MDIITGADTGFWKGEGASNSGRKTAGGLEVSVPSAFQVGSQEVLLFGSLSEQE